MNRRTKAPRELPTLLLLVVVIAALHHLVPPFNSSQNLTTLGKDAAIFGIMACGEGMVILSGGLDLSVGSVVALSSCVTAGALAANVSWPIAALVGLVSGALCGALNGALITYRRLPPILTTLATLLVFRYGTSIVTHARNYGPFPDRFNAIADGWNPTWIFLAVTAVFVVVTVRSRFGRWIFAMGGSEQAALLSGVDVDGIKRRAYLLSGLCAGLAALITMAFNNNTESNVGQGYELSVIAACVVGGIRITGGEGSILGAALGALLIALVPDALLLTGRPAEQYGLFTGAVVLAAAVIEQWRSLRQQRKAANAGSGNDARPPAEAVTPG